MFELLWLIPALPFVCSLTLVLIGGKLGHKTQSIMGAGMIGLSAVLTTILSAKFMSIPPDNFFYRQKLWTWMQIDQWNPAVALYLDPLSLIMTLVVTWVSFFILIYSIHFMAEDPGFRRFFAYMNLFVGFMLVLVLADDFLFLYLGWEGVGLCSYLLIGFWHREEENARAAFKAFLVTRIGDMALLIGLLLIFYHIHTLNIQDVMAQVSRQWIAGSLLSNIAAVLLLGGALGKSAQLPLQTWLPDAMAGPTPVSALIHASTMVTAGVYLIARTHVLFTLASPVQYLVAVMGAVTLLVAGSSALVQSDLKRALAYSTMSQVGYMFLGLGAGAWIAAVFHLVIHAFFKALLFLCAGIVIKTMHDERDMYNMGNLRRKLPLVFWTFFIGVASMSAVPLMTGGFYSKDLILLEVWALSEGGLYFLIAGLVGAFITSLYSFRLLFLVFYGKAERIVLRTRSKLVTIPLIALAVPALIGGYMQMPGFLGNVTLFSDFMRRGSVSLSSVFATGFSAPVFLMVVSSLVSLGGIYLAYLLFLKRRSQLFHAFLYTGWGFDYIYNNLIIRPFVYLTRLNRNDVIDMLFRYLELLSHKVYVLAQKTASGNLRWYATAIAFGAIVFIGLVLIS